MAFDWQRFLDVNHIHYVTTGPNVSRGHVAIKCPFCGSQDPSEHMSINLQQGYWRCFRRSDDHVGGSPSYLVAAILGISQDAAAAIVGSGVHIPENFLGAVTGLLERRAGPKKTRLVLPPEFLPLDGRKSSHRHMDYLTGDSRRFTKEEVLSLFTREYGLRFATMGDQRGRVIFPVWFEGNLVTWTGRTIYPDQLPRYKTLSTDPEIVPFPAHGPINDYLLFYDELIKNDGDNDTLIIGEGPFDALKTSVNGRRDGIDATCFFTAAPSRAQIDLLHSLVPVYKRRFLLLDQGTLATALKAQMDFSTLKIGVLTMPKGLKDPGLLTRRRLLEIIP